MAHVCKVKDKPPTRKEPRSKQHPTAVHPTHVLSAETDDYPMYTFTGSSVKPLVVSVKLNDVDLEMEVDNGASISIISEATYNRLWSKGQAPVIQESQLKLKTYSGEQLSVKGVIEVKVQYKNQSEQLQLVVACGNGPSLFGRDWLMKLRLDWAQLCDNHVCYSLSLQGILDEYSSVFTSELGTLKDSAVTISLDPTAQPRFCKAPEQCLMHFRGKLKRSWIAWYNRGN